MKKKALIKVLAAPEDLKKLQGVFDAMGRSGVSVSETHSGFKKQDIVLAVLSEQFYEDETLKSQLFDRLAVGSENILPLNLSDAPIPEEIMNLLFARNIIMTSGRNDEQLAERILSAIPERKNRMPAILLSAVAVLVLLSGLFFWRSMNPQETAPVMAEEEPVPNPLGITEEELAQIKDIVIIGDRFTYYTYDDYSQIGHWPDIYDLAYEVLEGEESLWYSTEDGHRFTLTRYEDLRFLSLMPNLNVLQMVLVDVDPEMLPDLSGADQLSSVTIRSCSMSDISWLSGSSVSDLTVCGTNIADYSPLSDCTLLRNVTIDGQGKYHGDISRFAPPAIRELYLYGMNTDDLSALSECSELGILYLNGLQIRDLDFTAHMQSLYQLDMTNLPQLSDISGLAVQKNLRGLSIRQCDQVRDYSPIHECSDLESVHIERWHWIPVDSSFLYGLSRLSNIGLFGLNLNNLDFLATANQAYGLRFGFAGDIEDYSGLSLVNRYQWMHVNPRSNGGRYGDFSLIEPHLQNVSITDLELYNCTNVDLAKLPEVKSTLILTGGNLKNLEGLSSQTLTNLELRDMQYLHSLDGIEALPRLSSSSMELRIYGCIRLTDYSALDGATLRSLKLGGMYSLPDFSKFSLRALRLESIEDMEDLSVLEPLDRDTMYYFEFPGLDDLKDLSILHSFKGSELFVPPQVAEQARELVESGNFRHCAVLYPDSGWTPLNEEVILLSMEELETLPKAVLRRVSKVWIAGDEIIDPNRYEVQDEWVHDHPEAVLYDYETGKTRKVSQGSITDFSTLSGLTNLRELRLFSQPITSLEGIQNISSLTQFEAKFCPDLQDISAVFALQSLEEISVQYTGVSTIQGVQNLPRLRHLNVFDTAVSDLSLLNDCDFSHALQSGGLVLIAGGNENAISDFSFLSAIPAFQHLNLCGYHPDIWMQYVTHAPIDGFCGQIGSDEILRQFVQQHPELRELLLEDGYHLTDLTPLLELKNLDHVRVWSDAERAGRSLKGLDLQFHLEIE